MDDQLSATSGPESSWIHKHITFVWAMIVAGVAVWRYAVPAVYNKAALTRLLDLEPLLVMLYQTPVPDIEDERIMLVHVGIAMCITAFILLFPSITRRHLTWWTIVGSAGTTVVAAFCAIVYVPYSAVFWNTVIVAVVLLSILLACDSSAIPLALRQAGATRMARVAKWPLIAAWRVLGRLAQPYRITGNARILINAVVVVGLFMSTFWFIPTACGRWAGSVKGEMARVDAAIYLVHMKDHQSVLHEELVDILFQNKDYLVVRLSEQVPHPSVFPDSPSTLPAEDRPGEADSSLSMPILVARSSVDCLTFIPSPTAMCHGFEAALQKQGFTTSRTRYQIQRVPGGGYEASVNWRGRYLPDSTNSAATSSARITSRPE